MTSKQLYINLFAEEYIEEMIMSQVSKFGTVNWSEMDVTGYVYKDVGNEKKEESGRRKLVKSSEQFWKKK